jgi:hypothetical protein
MGTGRQREKERKKERRRFSAVTRRSFKIQPKNKKHKADSKKMGTADQLKWKKKESLK